MNKINEFNFDFSRNIGTKNQLSLISVAQQLEPLSNDVKLTGLHLDLLDVAVAVYIVDRLCKRSGHTARTFNLTIPVRDRSVWSQPTIKQTLETTLRFLTEDIWNFTFVNSITPVKSGPMLHAYPSGTRFKTMLFSGGLDSSVGVMNEVLKLSPDIKVLLVAGSTSERIRKMQTDATAAMNTALASKTGVNDQLVPTFFNFELSQAALNDWFVDEKQQEKTQRSRGFIFPVIGAVTAASIGLHELTVLENGVGGINLPLVMASLGVDQSRSMHPLHLAHLRDFLRGLLGQPFTINNPNALVTKGQMCHMLATKLDTHHVRQVVTKSISCDSFPFRHKHPSEHCGKCTSCLLRRASVFAAKIDEGGSFYIDDLSGINPVHPKDKTREFTLMRLFARRLELAFNGGMLGLLREFPELQFARQGLRLTQSALTATEIDNQLVALYQCFAQEWSALEHSLMGSNPHQLGKTL